MNARKENLHRLKARDKVSSDSSSQRGERTPHWRYYLPRPSTHVFYGMALAHFNCSMNQIETRIADLVNWVRVDGAYCCRLDSVRDMVEKPATVLVMIRCQNQDASFEVNYGGAGGEALEEDDSILKRRIALAIVKIFAGNKMNEHLT